MGRFGRHVAGDRIDPQLRIDAVVAQRAAHLILPLVVSGLRAAKLSDERINGMLTYSVHNAHTLATWRLGKGIYRFDDDLRNALLDTPVTGAIPAQFLRPCLARVCAPPRTRVAGDTTA